MKKILNLIILVLITIVSLNSNALSNSVAAEDDIFKSVVFIKVPGPDPQGGTSDAHCNAALVNSKTLVTAAHCFLRSDVLKGLPFQIEVGEYKYVIRDGVKIKIGYVAKQKFSVTAKINFLPGVNPNAQTVGPDVDIASVILDSNLALDPNFPFASIWPSTLPNLTIQSKLTVVTVNYIETISHSDTKQKAVLNQFSQTSTQIKSNSSSRVAPGDSGGPLFATINNQVYLIGVVKGQGQSFGSNWDVFVLNNGRLKLN